VVEDHWVIMRYVMLPYVPEANTRHAMSGFYRRVLDTGTTFLNRANTSSAFQRVTRPDRQHVDKCVYQVMCTDCPGDGYIGETGRSFARRSYEHDYALRSHRRWNAYQAQSAAYKKQNDAPPKPPTATALITHMLAHNHNPDWNLSSSIPVNPRMTRDLRSRKLVESFHIAMSRTALNDHVSDETIFEYVIPVSR
jgi:hypothetical protein